MLSEYIADIQVQTFFLRMLHSFLILLVAVTLFRAAGLIDNPRVMRWMWKSATWMIIYFAARAIAGVVDTMYGFSIGWTSNLVQIIFWVAIVYKFEVMRRILASPKNNDQRQILRKSFDDLIEQLENAKTNARRAIKELPTH